MSFPLLETKVSYLMQIGKSPNWESRPFWPICGQTVVKASLRQKPGNNKVTEAGWKQPTPQGKAWGLQAQTPSVSPQEDCPPVGFLRYNSRHREQRYILLLWTDPLLLPLCDLILRSYWVGSVPQAWVPRCMKGSQISELGFLSSMTPPLQVFLNNIQAKCTLTELCFNPDTSDGVFCAWCKQFITILVLQTKNRNFVTERTFCVRR